MAPATEDLKEDWPRVYLKCLLFIVNFLFWAAGAGALAVGTWTLVESSGYLGVLASRTFSASASILLLAGSLVVAAGFLGFGAIVREQRSCLSAYLFLLLAVFLVELVAGVLAHAYHQRLSEELEQRLSLALAQGLRSPGPLALTASVDRLQQDLRCCGSHGWLDWQHSAYVLSAEAAGRGVPDSCCKTVVRGCGRRLHPSNIYSLEGGCRARLERLLDERLLLAGAVGLGAACLQVCGMLLAGCLYCRLRPRPADPDPASDPRPGPAPRTRPCALALHPEPDPAPLALRPRTQPCAPDPALCPGPGPAPPDPALRPGPGPAPPDPALRPSPVTPDPALRPGPVPRTRPCAPVLCPGPGPAPPAL
ncbi:LOW QUALITY PROTEIN: tetraspanin-11-like [Dipodomys merriami]|uniref:LOW QUALITY PROTEIN: tetraspanin-11-like n=1 Tax=Dipodomys merriami TaxID=94247 RepID=UPI003855C3D5